jgi:hypothetical protein
MFIIYFKIKLNLLKKNNKLKIINKIK